MTSDLASRLREGTKQSHTVAENTAFMQCFLKGIVEKQSFRTLIANLYFIYSALEVELQRHTAHPVVSIIWFPELHRQQNLEKDLIFYYGEDWREQIVPSNSTNAYVARIHHIANTEPALLVAHAYVRYMGDLSVGQSFRNMVRSAIELPADRGTALYEFESLTTAEARKAYKAKYRHALNSLPLADDSSGRIIDEANYVFQLNQNIFHELEIDVKVAIGEDVFNLIVNQHNINSTDNCNHHASANLVAAE